MIPKVIYYVWFGKKQLPNEFKKYIDGWKKLNPDYRIKCINEENFDINKYSFTKDAYAAKNWAFVSDLARLDTIYNYGGFYLDTDVKLVKSLEKLEEYKSVWALENSDAINSGLIIGAEKHDKNIRNIIDIYRKINYKNNKESDLITVNVITKYFLKKGFKIKNKTQILKDGTLILSSDYFAPYHYWGGGHKTKNTIGIHEYAATWKKEKMPSFFSKFGLKRELKLIAPTLYFKLKKIIKK